MLLSNIIDVIYPKEKKFYKKKQRIEYITTNSKLVRKNSIFVVDFTKKIKKEYINEAIINGATLILTNKRIKNLQIPQCICLNLNEKTDQILNILKPIPPQNMIAVTGTNGKSSVVWLISSILKYSGLNVKSLGTLGYYYNLKKISESSLTTPEKEEIHQLSFKTKKPRTEFVFEVSSHSISKKRINNLPINIAAITNISQDHLDYHKTFKNYKNTKFQLFLKYLSNNSTAIINENIKGSTELKQQLKKKNIKIITYGKKNSNVNYLNYKNKTKIKIYSKSYIVNFKTINDFELKNLACSICCCLAIGLENKKIIRSIPNINKPEGRMQLVDTLDNGAKIFIDYAHTPDALKNILQQKNYNMRPNIIFGCGGNRDKNKRGKMGKIAHKFANNIYITDDNPRNEKPGLIRKQIQQNCPLAYNIGSRSIAIKTAIEHLDSNEYLIIAGKGHEKKQILKNKVIKFNDFKVAEQYIKKLKSQKKINSLKNNIINYIISKSQKIKINSKDIKKGDIFCALKGSKNHGNQYIDSAFKSGAKYVVTDKSYRNYKNKVLQVENIFYFLQNIATKKRNIFRGKVIAVTGSVGKTTIKEYLNHFLLSECKVSVSIKSYNNYLGVLLSMLNMDLNSKFSIFEIGTSNFGEIKKLASLVKPEQVIISNINPTHLDNFKNTRNIAVEKSDLFNPAYNTNIKLLILPKNNKDEIFLYKIAKKYKIESIITYGENSKLNYYIKKIGKINNKISKITYATPTKIFNFKTSYLFKHQILNIIIPLIIFIFNKIPTKYFITKIKNIPSIYGRGSHHLLYLNKKIVRLINESYNASPVSMQNSIKYFNEIKSNYSQKKILIIGEMLELGKKSSLFHKEITMNALKQPIDIIIFCGSKYKNILSKTNLYRKNVYYFENEKKIYKFLSNTIQKNDIILAKGSNASKVNKFVSLLLEKEEK